ncbi:hypothetical protein KKF63_04875 [bacterium]|nr:hypothetical protein [bacterium]
MYLTKFDEMFSGHIAARCFTTEQIRHAKTPIPYDRELVMAIGLKNNIFGKEHARWNIPLFKGAGYGAAVAIGYYAIGHIQEQNPPLFHEYIDESMAFQNDKLFDDEWFKENMQRFLI